MEEANAVALMCIATRQEADIVCITANKTENARQVYAMLCEYLQLSSEDEFACQKCSRGFDRSIVVTKKPRLVQKCYGGRVSLACAAGMDDPTPEFIKSVCSCYSAEEAMQKCMMTDFFVQLVWQDSVAALLCKAQGKGKKARKTRKSPGVIEPNTSEWGTMCYLFLYEKMKTESV